MKGIVTICVFVVEEFLAPVKSTICYGKYIYLFKQNRSLILTFYAKNMGSLISSNAY